MRIGTPYKLLKVSPVMYLLALMANITPASLASSPEISKIIDMAPKSVSSEIVKDVSGEVDYSDLLVKNPDARQRLKALSEYVAIKIELPDSEKQLFQYFYKPDLKDSPGLSPEGMRLSEHFHKIRKEFDFMSKSSTDKDNRIIEDLVQLTQWLRREFMLKLSFQGLKSSYVIENSSAPELKLINIVEPSTPLPHTEDSVPSIVWEYGDGSDFFIIHLKGVTQEQCAQVRSFASEMNYRIAVDKIIVRADAGECKENSELMLIAE